MIRAQSSTASRSAVFAPTPRPGVMVWIASPISVTLEAGHGSSGTEVLMLTGKQVLGSVSSNSRRRLGCQSGRHLGNQSSKIIAASLHDICRELVRAGREDPS